MRSTRHLPPIILGLIVLIWGYLFVPVLAAWLQLGEDPSGLEIVGMVLVVVALGLLVVSGVAGRPKVA